MSERQDSGEEAEHEAVIRPDPDLESFEGKARTRIQESDTPDEQDDTQEGE